MPTPAPAIAKLSPPCPEGAVRRGRLHALLEERQRRPVVWVVGPPGAGKTTVVASFLAETGRPTLWYRIDDGDADPATFFFYLRQAVSQLVGDGVKPLPLLTPEYLADVPGFARRWMREAFRRLPAGTALVFDNYQDAGEDSSLHRALATAFEELPAGANAFVVSRRDPPPPFARAVVNATIATVAWEDLRLTDSECAEVAAARGVAAGNTMQRVVAHANGWMAGVVLMTERVSHLGLLQGAEAADSLETVFGYFAGLAFDSAEPRVREALCRTALLPEVTATTAEAVTGDPRTFDTVESLWRRNLFVDRAGSDNPTYRFHPLFHTFLRARAAVSLSTEERVAALRRAAQALENAGQDEAAYSLYCDADAWMEAERRVLESAQRLLDQGRWRTLDEWIARLPASASERNPWIDYWAGRSRIMVSPVAAKPFLLAVYERFLQGGDKVGQMLSAVSFMEALYLELCEFGAMDEWLARVITLIDDGVQAPTRADELRINATVVMVCSFRFADYAHVDRCVRRVEALLSDDIDPNLRIAAAGMLHAHVLATADSEVEMRARVAGRALLDSPQLTAYRTAHYLGMEGYSHYLFGRYHRAVEVFQDAESITTDHGLDELGCHIAGWRALAELRAGLLVEVAGTLARCESRRKWASSPAVILLRMAAIGLDFALGRTAHVVDALSEVHAGYERTVQTAGAVLVAWFAAQIALGLGRVDAAAAVLDSSRSSLRGPLSGSMRGGQALLEAWHRHLTGDMPARDALLREVLRLAADPCNRIRYRWYPLALKAMMPVALEQGIEALAVHDIIREFDVPPPSSDLEHWPWPVKIFTLGRFELLIDGKPAAFSRKAPRRLLELLKAIIAFGGVDIDERKLADALWPDDEGDSGVHALRVSVTRLRKLLGHFDAIQITDGKVSLEPTRCWVDALAFERAASGPESTDTGAIERVCSAYRGTFLGSDADQSWILPMRERLRTRFVESIERLGGTLESAHAWDRAAAWYQRGIDADPLIEAFHQGLIRCYLHSGRRAEALGAYRRLRQTLSVVLGISPSESSEALYRLLYQPETELQSVVDS